MFGEQNDLFEVEGQSDGSNRKGGVDLLQGLNPPQQEAVQHVNGPILVLAGAGSGKTRVLTHRVANLVLNHSVWPSRIFAVTFTNKAAGEMRHRLFSLLGARAEQIWISTFHSAGLRILRHNAQRLGYTKQFVVYDDQDTKGVLKQIIKELSINEERYPVDSFAKAIDRFKNNFILPAEAAKNTFSIESDQQAQVYDRYQKLLLQADAMDFGDLLVNAVRVLREFPDVLDYYRHALHYLLVDEFQDTNKVQYMFIRLLSEPRRNLFVVGDDDQSIYGFRGATISNILEFEKDYSGTKVIKLEQNYRSTATILNAAHGVIEKNKARKAKKLWTSGDAGEQIRTFIGYDENMEAEFIAAELKQLHSKGLPYSSMALLYRTNAQTRAIEDALVRAKVPYRIFGGLKFFDRKEIKDILAYLRLLVNPADNQAFQRIVNTPPRGIGAQALQSVFDEAERNGTPLLAASVEVAATHKGVRGFVELMAELKSDLQSVKLGTLISRIVQKSEYGPKLAAMKDPTALSRIENLQELEALGRTMERASEAPEIVVKDFLDRISLTSGADMAVNETTPETPNAIPGQETPQEKPDTVSLMTLHLAKGLEFPIVFLAGLEEGLLPHYRSLDDATGLEEERRLCYVGVTRAMKILYLTRAYYRGMFTAGGGAGGGGARIVSRFAKDIDPKSMTAVGTERSQGATFIGGYPRFAFDDDGDHIDDDGDSGGSNSRWRNRKGGYGGNSRRVPPPEPRQAISLDKIRSLLAPADAIQKQPETPKEYFDKAPAALEQLTPGVRVIHPTFGVGAVESVSGSSTSAMVAVRFESFQEPKKLVFRFAKLVLG
jgi:DNA helicase-2/ATP-dependent DNA helicase PcrA